jgi:hypothetical protein
MRAMAMREEYSTLAVPARLDRLSCTPDEVAAAISGLGEDALPLLRPPAPEQWERGGIHLGRGRLTLHDWVASLAAHDDNHLDQFRRAVDGPYNMHVSEFLAAVDSGHWAGWSA